MVTLFGNDEMRTWSDCKQKTQKAGGPAKERLDLSEAVAQITGAVYSAREQKGVSQRELARRANLSQSVIARFETGETLPRLDTLVKILAPLGLYLRATREDEPEEAPVSCVVDDTLTVTHPVEGRSRKDFHV